MFVYSLIDPRDHSTFYVGITINLYMRFKQHMRCDGTDPQKDRGIREILEAGFVPIMHTLEIVRSQQPLKRESYWIQYFIRQEVELTNIAQVVPGLPRRKDESLGVNPYVGWHYGNCAYYHEIPAGA